MWDRARSMTSTRTPFALSPPTATGDVRAFPAHRIQRILPHDEQVVVRHRGRCKVYPDLQALQAEAIGPRELAHLRTLAVIAAARAREHELAVTIAMLAFLLGALAGALFS